jgi:hypothetical protein
MLRQRVSVSSIDAALSVPPILIPFPVRPTLVDELRSSWLNAIQDHPGSYIDTRWDLWLAEIGWNGNVLWIQHPNVDPNPWGYRPTFPALEKRANEYVARFAASSDLSGGPLYKVWLYLLVDLVGILYLRHPDPRRHVLGALALTAVMYEVTFLFGAMGNQYRYSFPAVAVALVVGCVASRDLVARLAAGRENASPQPVASGADAQTARQLTS